MGFSHRDELKADTVESGIFQGSNPFFDRGSESIVIQNVVVNNDLQHIMKCANLL